VHYLGRIIILGAEIVEIAHAPCAILQILGTLVRISTKYCQQKLVPDVIISHQNLENGAWRMCDFNIFCT